MNLTRVTLATASSVLLLATLAACGDASSDANDTSDPAAQGGQQAARGGMPGGGFPGASGLVAAVSGKTAQVQSQQTGQVAVSWTADTTFTAEVDGSLDDVAVGACVMVTDASADQGSDPTEPAAEITAATVRVLATGDDGQCGFGGGMPGGGEPPEGAPSDLPEMPEDMPTDMPRGGRPGGSGTIGEVTAVSDDGFTVSSTARPTGGQDDSASADPIDVSVTVTGDTTYTTTADATAAAVKTGVCVTAQGDTDDTGALTASSISVSPAVDGQCTGGFGMGGGRPGAAS